MTEKEIKDKISKALEPINGVLTEIAIDFNIPENFEPDFYLATELAGLALEVINLSCAGCKDCIGKECTGWWIKFNLNKAKSNIPKQKKPIKVESVSSDKIIDSRD